MPTTRHLLGEPETTIDRWLDLASVDEVDRNRGFFWVGYEERWGFLEKVTPFLKIYSNLGYPV